MGIYPLHDEQDESRNRFFRRMRWGALAFVVATVVLQFIACPTLIIGGCHGGDTNVAIALAVLVEVALVGMLFAGRRMWRFTAGFFAAMLVAATCTRGHATGLWIAPAEYGIKAARPLWGPTVARQQANAAQSEWVAIKRTQHPTIVHGARLVNLVEECAQKAMLADSINSYPRSAVAILGQVGCESLRDAQFYDESVKSRYSEFDNGWRWQYVAGPQDPYGRVMTYAVRVSEDRAIERTDAPLFTSDEKGAITETVPGVKPRLVANPVASLVMLRKCLMRVPASDAALRASSPYMGRSSAMNSVSRVCPELSRHIATDYPGNDDNRGRLAVPAHEQAGEFTDTVGVYVTQFIPADVDGTIFELRASPTRVQNQAIRAGIRQFLVARDGSIHASVGQDPPTADDPIAAECLPGGGVDCGVAEATPAPAAGP